MLLQIDLFANDPNRSGDEGLVATDVPASVAWLGGRPRLVVRRSGYQRRVCLASRCPFAFVADI